MQDRLELKYTNKKIGENIRTAASAIKELIAKYCGGRK